jgi:hypothetical protein
MVPNIFSILIVGAPSSPFIHRNVYQLPFIEQKAPDSAEVRRFLQNLWVLNMEFASCSPPGA